MTQDQVEALADAVLYEGYLLYPYRPSAAKNRFRWTFGVLYPPSYAALAGERSWLQAEALVEGSKATLIKARARFLQAASGAAEPREAAAPALTLDALAAAPAGCALAAPAEGVFELSARPADEGLWRVRARLSNVSRWSGEARDAALERSLLSAQLLLEAVDGAFVSQTDPPADRQADVRACENVGCWPVLVGKEGSRAAMLAAPIILPDYPRVAPRSPGDLFDGTEIDEILTLRVRTLAEPEKREAAEADPRARALLERADKLTPEELARLHAEMQPGAALWTPGQRVRLRPRRRADILDSALAGRLATIESIERDFEDRVYVTVTLEDDPGRDLGRAGMPGHRFFFDADEVEAA